MQNKKIYQCIYKSKYYIKFYNKPRKKKVNIIKKTVVKCVFIFKGTLDQQPLHNPVAVPTYQAAEDADLSALNMIPELLLIAVLIREMS